MTTFVGVLTKVEKAAGTTTVDLPLPGGAVAGDLAVAGAGSNSNILIGTQTGWTTFLSKASTADTLAPDGWLGWRTIDATDISNGFVTLDSVPSATGNFGGGVYRNCTTTQDFTAVYVDKTSGSTFNFPTKTTTEVDVTLIYLCSQATVASASMTPPSAPAAFTEDCDRTTGRNMSMGHLIWSSSGATGTMTVTAGVSTRGIGIMVGLRSSSAAFAGTATFSGGGTLGAVGGPPDITGAIATLSGGGTLSTTRTIGVSGIATLSGGGTLSTTQTPRPTGIATLSGSGTLTTTEAPGYAGVATFGGSGTLSTTQTPRPTGLVTLSGAGTLSTTATVTAAGTASFSGAGTLSTARVPAITGATATLSGSGALTTTAAVTATGVATLSGSGTLSAVGVALAQAVGTATFSGSGTLSVTEAPHPTGVATFSGTGTLNAIGTVPGAVAFFGTATLSGDGTLTTVTTVQTVTTVSLSGSGTLSTVQTVQTVQTAALTGSGTLSVTTTAGATGAATLSGSGTLSVISLVDLAGMVTLDGEGTLSAFAAQVAAQATADFSGIGILTTVTAGPAQQDYIGVIPI